MGFARNTKHIEILVDYERSFLLSLLEKTAAIGRFTSFLFCAHYFPLYSLSPTCLCPPSAVGRSAADCAHQQVLQDGAAVVDLPDRHAAGDDAAAADERAAGGLLGGKVQGHARSRRTGATQVNLSANYTLSTLHTQTIVPSHQSNFWPSIQRFLFLETAFSSHFVCLPFCRLTRLQIEGAFWFSVVWSLGANLDGPSRAVFNTFLRRLMSGKLQDEGTVAGPAGDSSHQTTNSGTHESPCIFTSKSKHSTWAV